MASNTPTRLACNQPIGASSKNFAPPIHSSTDIDRFRRRERSGSVVSGKRSFSPSAAAPNKELRSIFNICWSMRTISVCLPKKSIRAPARLSEISRRPSPTSDSSAPPFLLLNASKARNNLSTDNLPQPERRKREHRKLVTLGNRRHRSPHHHARYQPGARRNPHEFYSPRRKYLYRRSRPRSPLRRHRPFLQRTRALPRLCLHLRIAAPHNLVDRRADRTHSRTLSSRSRSPIVSRNPSPHGQRNPW